jgi:hypothetical protein
MQTVYLNHRLAKRQERSLQRPEKQPMLLIED